MESQFPYLQSSTSLHCRLVVKEGTERCTVLHCSLGSSTQTSYGSWRSTSSVTCWQFFLRVGWHTRSGTSAHSSRCSMRVVTWGTLEQTWWGISWQDSLGTWRDTWSKTCLHSPC